MRGSTPTVAAAGLLMIVSTLLPWLIIRTPLDSWDVSASTATLLPIIVTLLVVLIVGLSLLERQPLGGGVSLATLVALAAAVVIALMVIPIEAISSLASRWIPRDLIPGTFRRVSFDAVAGPGLWIGISSCLLMAGAATASVWERFTSLVSTARDVAGRRAVIAPCIFVLALVSFVGARYLPWWTVTGAFRLGDTPLGAQGTGGVLGIAGWMFPFAGTAGLLAICLMCAGLGISVISTAVVGPLLATAGAWLASFASAGVIVVATGLPDDLRVRESGVPLLDTVLVQASNHGAALGAWLSLVAALTAAGCGVAMLGIQTAVEAEGPS